MKNLLLAFILTVLFASCSGPTPSLITPVSPVMPVTEDPAKPLQYFTGYKSRPDRHYGHLYWRHKAMYQAIALGDIPDTYDSRTLGCQMPIKDQKSCGSCWRFGSTTTGEINYCIETGNKSAIAAPWATQPGVSCDKDWLGCNGGGFTGKFDQTYGFFLESQWPYTSGNGNTGRCDTNKLKTLQPVVKPKSFVYIGAPDRSPTFDEVTAAIAKVGAVAVSFGADNSLNSIHSESDVLTRCYGTQINHMVSAIGFNRSAKWLQEQNSWGVGFGAQGYFKIAWGCNGTSEDAGYYVFEGTPGNPPKVHLPAQYIVNAGDDVTLAVKAEAGATYEWFQAKTSVGTGPLVTISPTIDADYRLVAKNQYGEAEVVTLVTIRANTF